MDYSGIDLERTVKRLSVITRTCEPNIIETIPGIWCCPTRVNVSGRIDGGAVKQIRGVRADGGRSGRRRRIRWRIDHTFEDRMVRERAGRHASGKCTGAVSFPNIGKFSGGRADHIGRVRRRAQESVNFVSDRIDKSRPGNSIGDRRAWRSE